MIATLGQRRARLERLLAELLPQTEPYDGAVTVTALFNNAERDIGQVRHDLLTSATGDYVSFVDDDDEVPYYFVQRVMTALADEPDYVGWRMQCYVDDRMMKPTYHSLRYDGWSEDARGYYRDVSHLNPIRTSIAREGDFRVDLPEDRNWAAQVRPLVRHEVFIPTIMYHYRSSTTDTTWRPGTVITPVYDRLEVDHPNFRYYDVER